MKRLSFQTIGLHPATIQIFQNILKNDRLAHAYIFYGKVEDKEKVALAFAKAINCTQDRFDFCSKCSTCKTIEHGNHPDILLIQPQGSSIKIDQLRELRKKFYYQTPTGLTRVVIITNAEKMRLEAANSLLKLLEEPPSPMVVILLTDAIQSILPTIQSRCQKIRLFRHPLEHRIKYQLKRGYDRHLAVISAHLHHEHQFSAEAFEHLCSTAIHLSEQILSNALDDALFTVLDWCQSQPSEHTLYLLDVLLYWLRDLIYFQATGKCQVFAHWSSMVGIQAAHPRSLILLAIENVMIARRLFDKPQLRPQDILEQMVLAIHRKELSQANGWQLIAL